MENNTYHKNLLGEIVARDFRSAAILTKAGLDFCCGGQKTLEQACKESSLSPDPIIKELIALETIVAKEELKYNDWDLDVLADYIESNHHAYIYRTMPELVHYTEKIARVHGHNHPELLEIEKYVKSLEKELTEHLHKEEKIIFPAIRLAFRHRNAKALQTVHKALPVLLTEHESAGNILSIIRRISNHYTVPSDGCQSYSVTYTLLEEFENDLHIHVHLENNILFPKSIKHI